MTNNKTNCMYFVCHIVNEMMERIKSGRRPSAAALKVFGFVTIIDGVIIDSMSLRCIYFGAASWTCFSVITSPNRNLCMWMKSRT